MEKPNSLIEEQNTKKKRIKPIIIFITCFFIGGGIALGAYNVIENKSKISISEPESNTVDWVAWNKIKDSEKCRLIRTETNFNINEDETLSLRRFTCNSGNRYLTIFTNGKFSHWLKDDPQNTALALTPQNNITERVIYKDFPEDSIAYFDKKQKFIDRNSQAPQVAIQQPINKVIKPQSEYVLDLDKLISQSE